LEKPSIMSQYVTLMSHLCHFFVIPSPIHHPHPTCVLQVRSPGVSTCKGRISQQLGP
jgi:hypothetical protein